MTEAAPNCHTGVGSALYFYETQLPARQVRVYIMSGLGEQKLSNVGSWLAANFNPRTFLSKIERPVPLSFEKKLALGIGAVMFLGVLIESKYHCMEFYFFDYA